MSRAGTLAVLPPPARQAAGGRRAELAAAALAAAVLLAVVASYAALIGAADWRSDDYLILAQYRDHGWPYLLLRLQVWSPRPVSETLFFLYGIAVRAAGRPAVGGLLALLWGVLAAALLVTGRWREPGRMRRVLLGLAVFATVLAGHEVAGVFYWPAGAVAYLPTLAGIALASFVVIDGRGGSATGRATLAAGLTLAATCSEAGAIYAAVFAAIRLAAQLALGPDRRRGFGADLAWLAAPLLVAAAVLGLLGAGRAGTFEGIGADSPYLHRLLRDLVPAGPDLFTELVNPAGGGTAVTGLAAKLCFVLGFAWCWRPPGHGQLPARVDLVAAVLAPLLAAYATLATAYYEFGQACCDRHATLRQGLYVLALAAAAVAVASRRPAGEPPSRRRLLAPLLLAAAAAIPAAGVAGGLSHDLRLRPAAIAVRRQNWSDGRAPGTTMAFRQPPPMQIVRGFRLPPGTYQNHPDTPWPPLGILQFFRKQDVTVLPPP